MSIDVLLPAALAFIMFSVGLALRAEDFRHVFQAPRALLIGLSPGGAALLMTLTASASYIAVPAAMRVALPEANPSIYLTLSLGITFPFNLIFGIPAYLAIAQSFTGG